MIAPVPGRKTGRRMGHMPITARAARSAPEACRAAIFIHINNTNPILIDGSPERGRVESAGWEVASDGMEIPLETPDPRRTGSCAARHRREALSPPASVPRAAAGGQRTKGQVQAWALNRYYYQAMIPIKDASLIARCEDTAIRQNGARGSWTMTATEGRGRHRALAPPDRCPRPRPRLRRSLRGLLPAMRFAVDAYVRFVPKAAGRSGRVFAYRIVFAQYHRRAGGGDAGEQSIHHQGDARLFRQASAAGRAYSTLRWIIQA